MRSLSVLSLLLAAAAPSPAQILRTPTGVNVASQGASAVFISYGRLRPDQFSVEAEWCPELIAAAPEVGLRCDPARSWGRLPARHDLSRASGQQGFTDIMSIPASLARRAWQAARRDGLRQFYYVRRFSSTLGLPDEYVVVTCRLAGGTLGTPFAITEVTLRFATPAPVLVVAPGATTPAVSAELRYTGSGVLRGRWEVVQPGDPPPTAEDLLPEGSLPAELRGLTHRWAEVGRFQLTLPPGGSAALEGPDPRRLPTQREGQYLLLLRLEASRDVGGDVDLGAVAESGGLIATGAAAGFSVPSLRYVVGKGSASTQAAVSALVQPLDPPSGGHLPSSRAVFSWWEAPGVAFVRLEVQDGQGQTLLTSFLPGGVGAYQLPPFVASPSPTVPLRWRVVPLDQGGEELAGTPWRNFSLEDAP